MIRKIGHWNDNQIDLAFVENNYFLNLKSEACDFSSELLISWLKVALSLWSPDDLTLQSLDTEGYSQIKRIEAGAATQLEARLAHYLSAVQASIQSEDYFNFYLSSGVLGWQRLAAPAQADWHGPWLAVDADGMGPRTCEVLEAEKEAGLATFWLRMKDAQAASYFSLAYLDEGCFELKLKLGPVFFEPKNEQRAGNQLLKNASLSDWQQANASLLAALRSKL